MKWKHLDLFSGIGGFAVAVEAIWGKENVTHIFCDNDKFCQQVLKKHWPKAKIYGDIRTLANASSEQALPAEQGRLHAEPELRDRDGIAADSVRERKLQPQGGEQEKRGWFGDIDILTGGFPCQPFSNAGKRRGDKDDRFLWPEMLRVIRETQPTWIVGENVAGIINMALEQVCADLENEGYEVRPIVIPAVALDAPHRRDRVWIIAHRAGDRFLWGRKTTQVQERHEAQPKFAGKLEGRSERSHRADTDSSSPRGQQKSGGTSRDESSYEGRAAQDDHEPQRHGENAHTDTAQSGRDQGSANAGGSGQGATAPQKWGGSADVSQDSERIGRGRRRDGDSTRRRREVQNARPDWSRDWAEVAAELCRMDDGLPAELDGFKLTKAAHRIQRLKSLGNAIVPQVATEIMRAIKFVECDRIKTTNP